MVLVQVSVVPVGTGTTSIGDPIADAVRVITTIVVDDRRDKEVTMRSKVAAVKKRLTQG